MYVYSRGWMVICLKLIAETEEENALLNGLGSLLTDLGVCVTEYRTEESYAPLFWSALELSYLYAKRFNLTFEDAAALLDELESALLTTMASAGAELIENTLVARLSPTEQLTYAMRQVPIGPFD